MSRWVVIFFQANLLGRSAFIFDYQGNFSFIDLIRINAFEGQGHEKIRMSGMKKEVKSSVGRAAG